MSTVLKQAVVAVPFVGMMALVFVLNRDGEVAGGRLDPAEALRRYGFYLTESAAAAGIDFRHENPTLDPKLAHIMPVVAGMGAAVSVVDFDADGKLDLYVVTGKEGGRNRLYRNRGDGTFEDVAGAMGVADVNRPGTGVSMGAIWADYDNDGFPDLFVYKWGKPELFHNRQGKGFDRVTDTAGLPAWVNANAACWLDYDRDGRLDLFVAGYWRDGLDLWHLPTTEVMPDSFEHAKNGGRKYLLRNKGDGTFEDVTGGVGITSTRWTLAVAAADLCGTGYPDIVMANDYGVPELYANKGGKRFEEVGYKTGIGVAPKSGMNASFGDVLNQGKLGIYISNITEPGNLIQYNFLWVPIGTKDGLPQYHDRAGSMNVARGGWSWGAKFGDLNNDGRLDLYLTNGYISADKDKSYWFDYGKIAGGLGQLIRDAKNWPPIGNQSLSGYQQKCVWMNKGGDFTDVALGVGVTDTYDGRAVSMGDLFNRGVLDVAVATQNGPLLLYKNTVAPGRDWVQFELVGGARPGREKDWSNRSAVGAQVKLTWRQGPAGQLQEQLQVVTAGDGYASQNMLRLHFGLGQEARIEKAIIKWPSGRTQTIEAPTAGVLHRVEETGP
ncbi:MAG: UnbV [Gemmataceae bacterium]|nr:UnbV [Gemmataceae bacterium]